MKTSPRIPNTWAPPASQVRSVQRVAPSALDAPKPARVAPPAAETVMPSTRNTNLRMEVKAGRAETLAALDPAGIEAVDLTIASRRTAAALAAMVNQSPMISQSFSVASEIVAGGGRMELCDGLLYVQGGVMLMTAETVRGVGEEGLVLMASARRVIDRDKPTGAMMSERQRALQKDARSDDWWAVPVSENMAPLGFAIFQAVLSGRHVMTVTDELYTLWMKALAALRTNLGMIPLRLTHPVAPGGRPLVKSAPMRAILEAHSAAELTLYLETARAVYTESSRDLTEVLAGDWPASWDEQPAYKEQLLRKAFADAVANVDSRAAELARPQVERMRHVLGTQPAPTPDAPF